jgi:proteasome lid subunit RPN8/RPN11
VSGADDQHLKVGRRRWRALTDELARRGRGDRESGAFLLARPDRVPRKVRDVVFFDDIDPDALNGAISIRGEAFGTLWDICEQRGMRVVADVHTHPGEGVGQSSIDKAHPMVARRGHVAIILPHFAQGGVRPRAVGYHIYQGDRTWTSSYGRDAAALLRRSWW